MTKPAKHSFRYIFLCVLFAFGLSGCNAFGDRPVPAPQPSVVPPSTVPFETADTKTVIVYARGMDDTEGTTKLLEAYNAQSDRYVVKYQELATDSNQRYQQLVTSLTAETAEIDVFDADVVWPAEFAERGFVAPVDTYIARDSVQQSDYLPGMVSALAYQGSIWGMPQTASAGVLYYRTDLMDSPPATWSELVTAAETQVSNGMLYGFVGSGAANDGLVSVALEFIYAYGGKVLDENGNVAIQSTAAITGLERMRQLYASIAVPSGIVSMTDNDACVSFLNGESAMMRNWPQAWAILNHAGSPIRDKFAIAPLPAGADVSVSVLGGSVIMMNAKTKNPEAAWDFMQFAAGEEGQAILAVHGGRVPALRQVMQQPDVIASNPHFGEESFIRAVENAVPRAITPFYSAISSVMQEELQKFLLFEQDAPETAANIDERIRALFGVTKQGA